MWAPADLFTPFVNAITFTLKNVVTYFYEHLVVLALVVLLVAALITLVTVLQGRRGRTDGR